MAENETQVRTPGKGRTFFERAEEVSATGNWDFAIEMYLQGILREPDNIERGHQPLREVSLKRTVQGGKGPGMRDRFKHKGGKTPEEVLINAEYLLTKEPGSVQYMVQMLQATRKLELKNVSTWLCDILLETQRQAQRPNMGILKILIETYHNLEEFKSALQACEIAVSLAPDNQALQSAINELSAKYTLKKGQYGEEGDFTKGVKDMEKQRELLEKDSMLQGRAYLEKQIVITINQYEAAPTVPGKINAAVDALLKLEEEAYENQAIDILTKAHKDTSAYQFKVRIGDIRIRQMTRRFQKLKSTNDKTGAAAQAKQQLEFELEEFAERATNYPTDLAIKYELGRRQFLSGDLDAAIASFQQAQRDPRKHIAAMNYLGQAFAKKGWFREAAETYEKALQAEMTEERGKDLRYSFADVLEKMDELERARDQLSIVAQTDFNYKDVRQRMENIHKKLQEKKD